MGEVNIAGEFPWFPAVPDDQLLIELAGGRWMPGTDDFVAVPGGTVKVVSTFGQMLAAIFMQNVGSVNRVNVFTHASPDLIAFGGHIEKRVITRADVFLNLNGPGANFTAMDPTSMNNLNQPDMGFTYTPQGGKTQQITIGDLQKRFTKDAKIVLYACHTGLLPSFLASVATFFQVEVFGFTVEIGYFPPDQTVPNKFLHAGMKIGLGFNGAPVTNWRSLIAVPNVVISAKPVAP